MRFLLTAIGMILLTLIILVTLGPSLFASSEEALPPVLTTPTTPISATQNKDEINWFAIPFQDSPGNDIVNDIGTLQLGIARCKSLPQCKLVAHNPILNRYWCKSGMQSVLTRNDNIGLYVPPIKDIDGTTKLSKMTGEKDILAGFSAENYMGPLAVLTVSQALSIALAIPGCKAVSYDTIRHPGPLARMYSSTVAVPSDSGDLYIIN